MKYFLHIQYQIKLPVDMNAIQICKLEMQWTLGMVIIPQSCKFPFSFISYKI